jgi:multimeric flavodoxin WrbA
MSAKVQVIFYSMYGHVYQMAEAVAAGARDAEAEVSQWQVAVLVPDEILEKSGARDIRPCARGNTNAIGRSRRDHLRHSDAPR